MMAPFQPFKSKLSVWLAQCVVFGVALFALVVPIHAQILVSHRLPPHVPTTPATGPIRPVPTDYRIRNVNVQATVANQAANVQISQTFENTGPRTLEAVFVFPIAEDAAVNGVTLLVDGKELPGKLLSREEARRRYEEIVRSQRDPALLEYVGRGLYQTSVFPIPANEKRVVEIRYSQLLKSESGIVDFSLPIGATRFSNKPIDELNVTVRVETTEQIKTVYSPTHSVEIQRPDNTHAVCKLKLLQSYTPDDLRLLYGTVKGAVGMSLLSYKPSESEDGYFLLLANPEIQTEAAAPVPRTMLFVFDRSGSMSGKKIEQAREALKFLVRQLNPQDMFNIVSYDSRIEPFQPELQRADEASIKAAIQYIDGIYTGGGTNIDGALKASFPFVTDPNRPSYLIFMTDGLPTVGETKEQVIAQNAKPLNLHRARLYAFGVGFDVNARLLDRLVADHRGHSVYVKPNEDIEAHVATLYRQIAAPLLTDLAVTFDRGADRPEKLNVSRTYPRQLTDLYQGEQLVYVGRYREGGDGRVVLSGKQRDAAKQFAQPIKLATRSTDDSFAFVEKLWATRRIGEIIDELDLHGQNKELVDELVQLSLKHGVMTPYTSFLADETVSLSKSGENLARAEKESRRGLDVQSGQGGVTQRAFKGNLQRANNAAAGGLGGIGGGGGQPGAGFSGVGDAKALHEQLSTNRGRGAVIQDTEGRTTVTSHVQNIGQKTYYYKNSRWQDSAVSDEAAAKAKRITQFSDEYFALANRSGGKHAKYLAIDGPVVVDIDGELFQIDPPTESTP